MTSGSCSDSWGIVNMSNRLRWWRLACAVIGAGLGYAYARYDIAARMAYMRAKWGWVCGTGLDVPLYVWPSAGAIVGLLLVAGVRRLLRFPAHLAAP